MGNGTYNAKQWNAIGVSSTVAQGRFYGVMVITLDFESSNPSSSLGRTLIARSTCTRYISC